MPFPAQTVPVGQLLANPFVIEAPAYQRSFAWADKEAGKLLDDIVSAPYAEVGARNGEYFLGAMLFIERPAGLPPEELASDGASSRSWTASRG